MTSLTDPDTAALELGFLSPHNPYDRCAFSGTAYFAAQALERHPGIRLRILGNHTPPNRFARLLRRQPSKIEGTEIDPSGLDAVLGMAATPLLAGFGQRHPDLPLLHVTDATPDFLREAYGWALPAGADTLEAQVADQAAATVYSSDIMARRAPSDLGLPGLATTAIPFGVNLDALPDHRPEKSSLNKLNLLFVGLDWTRKGGDIAVAALDQLNAAGQAATLTIVGRCPERHRSHPAIRSMGFLNKGKPRDRDRLSALYAEAHLLLLPSRGDCTPMVVAEAMAHGTPVLATDTGGIAAQIARTGRVLPLHATPLIWAETIREMTADRDGYEWLSDACFDRSQAVFSWDRWAEGIDALARSVLGRSVLERRHQDRPMISVAS